MPSSKISSGIIELNGLEDSIIDLEQNYRSKVKPESQIKKHKEAIDLVLRRLARFTFEDKPIEIDAVGHRVVHGGNRFIHSAIINDEVKKEIAKCNELAPLHNPPNLLGIEAAMHILPTIPHIAVFDTAFFSTIPPFAYTYAVPKEWKLKYGIRRYGFHGTSHLYVCRRTAAFLSKNPDNVNMISLHIGNGVSITAVKNGLAYDHSMGFTPLEGAVMGTRCGDLDPSIPLYLMRKLNLDSEQMEEILNRKSGLLGITGKYADRRDIIKGVDQGDEDCKLAFEIECYRLKKYIGAYSAALGNLNAITFTGGTGERSPRYREKICKGLEQLGIEIDNQKNSNAKDTAETEISANNSKVKVFVVPTNEEIVIAEDTVALLEGRYAPYWEFKYSFDK